MKKKLIAALLSIALVLSLAACGQAKTQAEETAEADSPITMSIALGNGEAYYEQLVAGIKEDLGIDVELVYQVSQDTSTFTKLNFKHNDMAADIVFTASRTPDDYLEDCCLDLLSETHVTSSFTYTKLADCTSEDGAIYQLPYTSKLIGITYNETLLNELGCEVPETFEDMVKLKEICDEKGITFAISDGAATGHGFNWLFHLMGSQWLSTTEGTTWFESFLKGDATVDKFKEKCEYFKKWNDAGLFGTWNGDDWMGSEKFQKQRALFWYGLTNSITSYDGPQDGTDKELHDVYKSMPWISEDGTNNCYTTYDNSWVSVKKELGEPGNEKRLADVVKILDYMASDKAIKMATDISSDIYVAVNSFDMAEDRLYYAFADNIKNGFIQPWYYISFTNDQIVKTGEAVNNYISAGASFDDIFSILEKTVEDELNNVSDIIFTAEEKLSYESTAKIAAISGALALQQSLDDKGIEETVQVTLCPYTENANELQPWRGACVVNTFAYEGDFEASSFNTILPQNSTSPSAIYMTGKEINELCSGKFDPASRFIDEETGLSTFDSEKYGPYPYVCLVKDNAELDDATEYLVCVSEMMLTEEQYQSFADAGKIIEIENTIPYSEGVALFGATHPTVSNSNITW